MQPTTILVVDEDPAVVWRVCDPAGFVTLQATRGDPAITAIERQPPSVIITSGGRGALTWIAEARVAAPDALIIVTGDDTDLTALDAGADIILASPLAEAALVNALKPLLEHERGELQTGRLSLVIVEPDVYLGAVMQRWLGSSFDVSLITTGWRAVELVRIKRPDAVLAELRLPDMDAPELHAALEREAPGLGDRVLFMTTGFIPDIAHQFLAKMPGQWIYKPFDLARLRAALAALIET